MTSSAVCPLGASADAGAVAPSGDRAPSVLGPVPALAAVLAATRARTAPLVLVDGPSGAGKSTFADRLLAAWPARAARLVRLDEVYPGWHGLDSGAACLRRDLVDPLVRDAPARWPRWG